MSTAGAGEEAEIVSPYDDALHRDAVIGLWNSVFGYPATHNDPGLSIDRKLAAGDGLFFVALAGKNRDAVRGTIMAGYDGHRGWIYSLAVAPAHRRQGIASRLLTFAEDQLIQRGCVKINLQILEENGDVVAFYERNGYQVEPRISMGKRIIGA